MNRRPSQLLLLQADTRHLIPVTTPCSQPLRADLRSSVTHGIGSVTDVPEISCDLYSKFSMILYDIDDVTSLSDANRNIFSTV